MKWEDDEINSRKYKEENGEEEKRWKEKKG